MPQTTYYAIALVVTVAVGLTLAAVAWRRRSVPGGTYFALMMLSGAWWAFTYACEALSKEQPLKIIWVQLSELGDGTLPVFFMLFALSYWRPDIRIRLQYQIMIWLIPVATIIIAATNGLHGILWSEITPSAKDSNILVFEHGPWFYVSIIYYYLTLWVGVVLLFRAATSLSRIYRRQALIVLVAAVLPWIVNAFFLLGFSPLPGLDMSPIMSSVTGLLLAFGIVKFQLFKVLPIAKEIVYKQIENGVLVVSSGGIIVDINPAVKNMLGADVEVGQNLEAALKNRLKIPFPLPSVHQRLEASLDDREKPLWLDVVIAPLYDRRSQLSGHLIMLHDISERKRAEEALKKSEERYRLLAENATDLIWTANIDMKLTYISPSVRRLLGYTVEEAMALPMGEVYTPASVTAVIEVLKEEMALEQTGLADPKRSRMLEVELYRKDGSIVPVETNFSIIRDVAGKNVGTLAITRDITERKKAAEAQHRLAVIVESSHDAILSKTLDGIITTWNRGAEMLYGYTADEVTGRPVSILIPPEFADEGRQFLEKIKRGEAVRDHEAERITKDGKRINVLLTISPIKDMSGRIIGASAIAQNITELRRAAEVVKESEKKYRDLFENANEAIFVAQDARLVFTNPTLTKLFGYSAEELSAKLFIEFIYPDDRDMVIDRHRRRLTGEELPPVYAFRVVRRDGNVRWVELSAVVIEWEGKPATLNFLSDITERTETEEALRESERKYRSLTEKMNDIVWIMGLDLRTTYVSPSVFKGLGFTPEEHMKRQIQDQLTPESLRDITQTWTAELERDGMEGVDPNRTVALEVEYYRKDGSTVWMENVVSAIRDDQGKAVGLHGVSRDITERKRAEEALRESEEKFKDLSEQLPQTIFEIDLGGNFTYANRYGLEFHGYTLDEITKDINAIDFFVPEQRQRVTENMAKILRGEEYDNHEYSMLRKDGSTYPALIYSNAIVKNGQPVGIRGIIVDITERKKVEQMKSDFVSFISHQLRTPVAGLMAYIDNMLEGITGELNDKQGEYLSEMRGVCARGNQLIADLLNVSRLERGVISVNIQPTYLRDKVEMAVREYKTSIAEKGLELDINEVEQGISVLADGDKLAEVLKNVIHNAYKFTKAGLISIEISSEGNMGIVKVKDTGIGMTETVMKDLFKKERVFGGAIAAGGGAGLGLYIAKGFMKLQGGDIMVESVVGKGSTFIISLPRR